MKSATYTKGIPVVIRVRVKNVGREGSTIWRNQFELEDARRRRYNAMTLYDSTGKLLGTEELNPGLQTEGFLIFDVPENALNQRWYLAIDGALFEQSAYIDLGQSLNWDDRR